MTPIILIVGYFVNLALSFFTTAGKFIIGGKICDPKVIHEEVAKI